MSRGNAYPPSSIPRSTAGIVFGSATAKPLRKRASVRATCEAIKLARSTYYYQSHRSPAALELERTIILRLHEWRNLDPEIGYRTMTRRLQKEGFRVNHKRISRLMHLHNLTTKFPMPSVGASRENRSQVTAAMRLAELNRLWVADIAYVQIQHNLVYAAVIIDAYLREVIGYAASLQIKGPIAGIALHAAARARRPTPGCVHHSTSGAHYLMRGYCLLLRQFGLTPSGSDEARGTVLRFRDSRSTSSHQIIEMHSFEAWNDVSSRPREFIETVYSRERVDRILGDIATRSDRSEHHTTGTVTRHPSPDCAHPRHATTDL